MMLLSKILIAVAAGGALGTLTRFGLTTWVSRWGEYGRAALYMSGSAAVAICALLPGLALAGLVVQRS